MSAFNKDQQPPGQLRDRRRFLTRNLRAMGAIAATVFVSTNSSDAKPKLYSTNTPKGKHIQCFLKGAKIRTLLGEQAIEELAIGDVLPTHFHGKQPVTWIGRYACTKSDAAKSWAQDVRPVKIARSALAPNVPNADLYLSGWHCVFVDGALIPAANLINGSTITDYLADDLEELEYFHIKLGSHDVIEAQGLPCETLLELGDDASPALHSAAKREYAEAPCAPMLFYEGRRGQIQARLRSAISPWYDFRRKIDIIRDRIEDRGAMLAEMA